MCMKLEKVTAAWPYHLFSLCRCSMILNKKVVLVSTAVEQVVASAPVT